MKYSIAGTVAHVGETKVYGSKGFQKRKFVIEIGNDKYPNPVALELHKDAADTPPEVGDKVEAEFYLQGNEWKGEYYVSLKCAGWKADGATPAKPAAKPATQSANPAAALGLDDADGNLPF